MNRSWFVFYGHQLNMTRQETMLTAVGEMIDMINCLAIYNGGAKEKDRKLSCDEIVALK